MTLDKPYVNPPLVENIPLVLRLRRHWVVWAYEWRPDREGDDGKWTKVPYTPGTVDKARTNTPSTWRTFQEALDTYQAHSNFFSGVGYVFSKDDPFVGGDRDNNLSTEGIPQTYAEVSPSGKGIKFIAEATGEYGRKTPKGELYSKGRFFTITGNIIEGHCQIASCQEAVDTFLASLGNPERAKKEGRSGKGDRAAFAAAHAPEEWTEARRQQRVNISPLLGELNRRSVSNKTGRRDTMLAYILREDYRGFHEKWPHVGIVRGDGSIDSSQIRAVMANSIKGRGFPFPEFVALMSHFYGRECLTKWSFNKQAVQEEFATLWHDSRSPRTGEYRAPIAPVKRGRGSDHATLLDRAYLALQDHKAGAQAFITQQVLADYLGVNRRTAITLMQQLRDAGRITYVAMRNNAGIVVSFGGVINEKERGGNTEHSNGVNKGEALPPMSATSLSEGVINDDDEFAFTDAENAQTPLNMCAEFSEIETDQTQEGVINGITEGAFLSSTDVQNSMDVLPDERKNENPYKSIYISNTVSLSSDTITPPNRANLKDAVTQALDELPRNRPDESTGELHCWPVTLRRVVEFVQYEHSERGWNAKAIEQWYKKVRWERKNKTFEDLRAMKRDALDKKHASLQKEITRYERKAATDPDPIMRPWWAGRANAKRGALALHAGEIERRNQADSSRIATEGYSDGEQAEFLELVAKEYSPPPKRTASVSLPTAQPETNDLIDRLRVRKQALEETRGDYANAR